MGLGLSYNDCDDDGETAAGSRLAEILRIMGVTGVAVIVSRWYGGTKLGMFVLNIGAETLFFLITFQKNVIQFCAI